MRPAIRHILITLFFLLLASLSQAQDIDFNCKTVSSPLTQTSTDLCKASKLAAPVVELTKFATTVYDLVGYGSLPSTLNGCVYDQVTGNYSCQLSSANDSNQVIDFGCTISYDNNENGIATCQLPNTQLASAMTMTCIQDSLSGTGKCKFSLNRKPILSAMQNASNFKDMNINQRAIHDAFWTCLNRVGLSEREQVQCDRVLLSLIEQPETASEIVDALKAVTPTNADLTLDVSSFNVLNSLNNIISRITQLRSGYASNSVNIRYFDGQQWLDKNTLLASNDLVANDVSPEPTKNISNYGRLGFFLNGSTINSQQELSQLEQKHNVDTQTATLGMDYRFTDDLVGGLAINITQSSTKLGLGSGNLDTDSKAVVLYGSYYIHNWYLDTSINYGKDKYDQERNVYCKSSAICPGGFYQSFGSNFDGTQSLIALATGYQWQWRALGLTPFIQFNASRIKTDAYTELPSSTGSGSNYALSIDDMKRDSRTAKLGVNLQYTFGTSQGVIIPLLGIYGVHDFENNSDLVTGHFIGNIATDSSFNLAANDIDRSYFIFAAGLSFQLKNGNAGFINVQNTQGYDRLVQTQITAGWRWEL